MTFILENSIDVYYYPRVGGLSSWDICAGEALIKAIGGVVTDKKHKPIEYSEDLFGLKGIVVGRTQKVWEETNR